jgi:hypothetical protein
VLAVDGLNLEALEGPGTEIGFGETAKAALSTVLNISVRLVLRRWDPWAIVEGESRDPSPAEQMDVHGKPGSSEPPCDNRVTHVIACRVWASVTARYTVHKPSQTP